MVAAEHHNRLRERMNFQIFATALCFGASTLFPSDLMLYEIAVGIIGYETISAVLKEKENEDSQRAYLIKLLMITFMWSVFSFGAIDLAANQEVELPEYALFAMPIITSTLILLEEGLKASIAPLGRK